MRVHSLSMSRSQDLALLPICCSISVSKKGKGSFYIAQYPVHWTAQSSLIALPGRHVHSDTNSASPGSILAMQQLRATTKSLTCPPLSTVRYSFIQLSQQGRQWRERKCPIFETVAKRDLNLGSLDCESGILPLSYRAPCRSSKPAAFPGFNRLRAVASSSRLKGLVSSVGGWLLLGAIVLWSSPGGLWCSTLLPLDNSWLAIWSAVIVVTTGGETLSAPRQRMVAHAFLLLVVRSVFSTMSLQILRLSSEISSSKVSPSWIVDSENGSLLYSS